MMFAFFKRLKYRFVFLWNYNKSLNRRATVESYLMDCANGKTTLPDKDKCRELAYTLGVREFTKKD